MVGSTKVYLENDPPKVCKSKITFIYKKMTFLALLVIFLEKLKKKGAIGFEIFPYIGNRNLLIDFNLIM